MKLNDMTNCLKLQPNLNRSFWVQPYFFKSIVETLALWARLKFSRLCLLNESVNQIGAVHSSYSIRQIRERERKRIELGIIHFQGLSQSWALWTRILYDQPLRVVIGGLPITYILRFQLNCDSLRHHENVCHR